MLKHLQDRRHPREGGGPSLFGERRWIPAVVYPEQSRRARMTIQNGIALPSASSTHNATGDAS